MRNNGRRHSGHALSQFVGFIPGTATGNMQTQMRTPSCQSLDGIKQRRKPFGSAQFPCIQQRVTGIRLAMAIMEQIGVKPSADNSDAVGCDSKPILQFVRVFLVQRDKPVVSRTAGTHFLCEVRAQFHLPQARRVPRAWTLGSMRMWTLKRAWMVAWIWSSMKVS